MSYATLVGSTVVRNQTGSAVYYTPPIIRRALKATFSIEATHFVGSGAVVVTVEHKDLVDPAWATAGAFADISATGVKTLTVSALKELIRFKFAFSGGGPFAFAHLVVAAVVWLVD